MDRLAARLIAADLGEAMIVIDVLAARAPDLATHRGVDEALARVQAAAAALRRAEVALRAEAELRGARAQ